MCLLNHFVNGSLGLLLGVSSAGCAASHRGMRPAAPVAPVASVTHAQDAPAQVRSVTAVCAYQRPVPAVTALAPAPASRPGSGRMRAAIDHAPAAATRPLVERRGPLPLSHSQQPRTTDCGMGMGEVLRAQIEREQAALRACYDAHQHGPPIVEARAVIRLTYASDGNVARAEVLDALFDERGEVSRCLASLVACWHALPLGCDAGNTVTVNYPLRFEAAP